jgi:hypothetical protein
MSELVSWRVHWREMVSGGDAGAPGGRRSGASRVEAMGALVQHGHVLGATGAHVLARAGSVLVKGVHERVQGGERKKFDTVVRSRDGQR